jgi:endogenous inhibitor of DNA gyrase (YacG/DUF329 family)
MKKNLEVKCPQCKTKFNYYDGEFRPFCSDRCQMVDLGQWFNESYTLPSKEVLSDEDIEKVIKEHNQDEE